MATCKVSGNQVAIKLYHKNKLSELNIFQVSREIQIHTRLNHKNIIQLVRLDDKLCIATSPPLSP